MQFEFYLLVPVANPRYASFSNRTLVRHPHDARWRLKSEKGLLSPAVIMALGPRVPLSVAAHDLSMWIERFAPETTCWGQTLGWSQETHQRTNRPLSSKPSRF